MLEVWFEFIFERLTPNGLSTCYNITKAHASITFKFQDFNREIRSIAIFLTQSSAIWITTLNLMEDTKRTRILSGKMLHNHLYWKDKPWNFVWICGIWCLCNSQFGNVWGSFHTSLEPYKENPQKKGWNEKLTQAVRVQVKMNFYHWTIPYQNAVQDWVDHRMWSAECKLSSWCVHTGVHLHQ